MISRKTDCSGCGACQNICSQNAVSMCHEIDSTYPMVDKEKCIECGLCVKVCPLGKKTQNYSPKIYPTVYACRLKDIKTLKNSTSGGAFIAFAKKILAKGGVVFGAVSNKDFRVSICSAESEDELVAMQGSKYVESNTEYSFREVKKNLAKGRICLYTALPCQIAGLLSYLEICKTSLDNLYTMDIVCHGTPSEILYLSWLKNYEKIKNIKLAAVQHRYKFHSWNSMVPKECAYISNDGKKKIQEAYKDGYLNGFIRSKTYKNNCYKCKYAHMPRISDITVGDYTGLGAIKKYRNNYKSGVSQLLINTVKGSELFASVKDDMIYEQRELYEALFFNRNLWKPSQKSADVDKFIEDFKGGVEWDELRKRYFDGNIKSQINMRVKALLPKILGATFTLKVMYYIKKKKMSPTKVLIDLEQIFNIAE